jgi:uncharacterized protein (TIGR03437 family)
LVISPYARQGYIDHKTYSFESWLRLIEERFGVNSLTSRDNNSNDMYDAFDFSQQPRSPVVLNPDGSPYPPTPQQVVLSPGTVATVNAAYGTYSIAPNALASAYASPPVSGSPTLTVTDSAGTARNAQVYSSTSNVVNFIVPSGTTPGNATVAVRGGLSGTALVGPTAPALFTANQTGQGPAAGEVITTHADGSQSLVLTFTCDSSGQNCASAPIGFGGASNQLTLVLYGTGIRGYSSSVVANIANLNLPVAYAGAQPTYAGLDQVNIALPSSLAGLGQVVVTVTVDGQATNMVQIAFH